jgi:hypothetical protein
VSPLLLANSEWKIGAILFCAIPHASQVTLSPHPEELARASVSKDVAQIEASWFETALTRLLTMRDY